MIGITIFFCVKTLSISIGNYDDKNFPILKHEDKNKNPYLHFTEQGFYSILIKKGDEINIFLNGGKQSLFFFIPFSSNFYVDELKIDGITTPIYSNPNNLCVEGEYNATLRLYSNNTDIDCQVNFWIIPSDLCYKSSVYVYGSNVVELFVRGTQLCVFSPTFDSKSGKFTIETGTPFNKGYHYTSLYTTNYTNPYFINMDNDIQKQTVKTAIFVKYFLNLIDDDNDHYYSIFYRRKTKVIKYSKSESACEAKAITRCNSNGGCLLDYVDFVSTKCNKYDIENLIVATIVVGIAVVVTVSLLIYCFVLSKRNKAKEKFHLINEDNLNNEEGNGNYTQEDNQNQIKLFDF